MLRRLPKDMGVTKIETVLRDDLAERFLVQRAAMKAKLQARKAAGRGGQSRAMLTKEVITAFHGSAFAVADVCLGARWPVSPCVCVWP